jgi:hypothetical protein
MFSIPPRLNLGKRMNLATFNVPPVLLVWSVLIPLLSAADLTFFSWSDTHYEVEYTGGQPTVTLLNNLPGTQYPASIGGVVATPRGLIIQGDLIDDGAAADRYPTQWANWIADFGVNGEGRCLFPVFEGLGNHDLNNNLFVYQRIAERNQIRLGQGLIDHVSPNGYHYSWDWEGVHFINLNLFCGNVWRGEADTYGNTHDPKFSRDFLRQNLQAQVGDSGRPVVVIQHYQPINDNWWTFGAIDQFHKVLQDYNVITIMAGHQGSTNNNTWRGIHWASSNGTPIVYRISPDNKLTLLRRTGAGAWTDLVQKNIFTSYATSGLAAAVNNGDWASNVTPTGATLSGKLLYEPVAATPTEITLFWGTTDGGTNPGAWQSSRSLGVQSTGTVFSTEVLGLQPWTNYFYRCRASNSQGTVWAASSVQFTTAGELPTGWGTRFLGYEQRPWGGARESAGTMTLRGSGRTISGTEDDFQFAYRALDGDGELIARITSVGTTANPKVGVMLREALTDNSRHVGVLRSNEGIRLASRSNSGGSTTFSTNNSLTAVPYWVKIKRAGNSFTGFHSQDGSTWTQVGSPVTIPMPPSIFAGLALCAGNRNSSANNTTTFDGVSISGESLPMPPTISGIADQAITVGGSTGPLPFTVTDLETEPSLLLVTAASSNTALVPQSNILVGGAGSNRTVTVTPLAGQTGSAIISLTVDDGTMTSLESFIVTVEFGQIHAQEWRSLASHASNDRPLLIANDNFIEPRMSGAARIEVVLSEQVLVDDPNTAVAISGMDSSGPVSLESFGLTAHAVADGNHLVITFRQGSTPTALPDATRWRFTLNPAVVSGVGGLILTPSAATTRVISPLIGDFDGNGRVTGRDLNAISNSPPFDSSVSVTLRADINGDGQIDSTDITAAWASRGRRNDALRMP